MAGLGMSAETAGAPRPLAALTVLLSMVLVIWSWVEIGLRRGEPGANRFGDASQAA